VYVFERSGGAWTQQAKLLPDDGATFGLFGGSVAIDGDWAVIGAPGDAGSAYAFERSGTDWTQKATLLAVDRASGDRFGHSVAVAGDTVVVGAPDDGD
jgi:hypothetical protein